MRYEYEKDPLTDINDVIRFLKQSPQNPYYDFDTDYTTNSPNYYDYLAKLKPLIQILAERIYDYDRELAKRFEEWDKNLEELPDELKRMFLEWVDDGTLARILAQLLLDDYATKEEVNDLLNALENDLNIEIENTKEELIDLLNATVNNLLEDSYNYYYPVHHSNLIPENTKQENNTIIEELNNSDYDILFFKKGIYEIDILPTKLCFGKKAILRTPELDIELDGTPQQVNSFLQNQQRLNNTVIGVNAGTKLNNNETTSYGNTAVGYNALHESDGNRRNTAVGTDTLKHLKDGYSATAIGVGAMQRSVHNDRNTAVGGNAGTWVGATKSLLSNGHVFYTEDRVLDIYKELWPDFRSYVGSIFDPNFYATDRMDTTSNVMIGRNALGFGIIPKRNVAIGYNAMESSVNGTDNVAVGECSMQYSIKADQTTTVGNRAGWGLAKTEQDTAIGCSSMKYLSDSGNNTAVGYQSMANLKRDRMIKPRSNTAIGRISMANADKDYTANVGVGENTLTNITGDHNTAIGVSAGASLLTGNKNTFIGHNAGTSLTDVNSVTALGYNALNDSVMNGFTNITGVGQNSSVTGSNQLQLGNSSTDVYAFNAVQTRSDERDKKDIKDSDLGLEFISKLRPVKYKWNLRDGSMKGKRYHYGLSAQEVEQVTKDLNIDFGGLQHHEKNGGQDVYSVGYTELIAPMIKAIQELTNEVNTLKSEINELKGV